MDPTVLKTPVFIAIGPGSPTLRGVYPNGDDARRHVETLPNAEGVTIYMCAPIAKAFYHPCKLQWEAL